jgi:hypothetical protein
VARPGRPVAPTHDEVEEGEGGEAEDVEEEALEEDEDTGKEEEVVVVVVIEERRRGGEGRAVHCCFLGTKPGDWPRRATLGVLEDGMPSPVHSGRAP